MGPDGGTWGNLPHLLPHDLESPAFGETGYRVHQLATLVAQLEATSAEHVKLAVLSGLEYAVEAAEKEDRLQNGYHGQYSALLDLINHMTGYTRTPPRKLIFR
jgi:hypothetical protein